MKVLIFTILALFSLNSLAQTEKRVISIEEYEKSKKNKSERYVPQYPKRRVFVPRNFVKFSLGGSKLENYTDSTGTIDFDDSYILPLTFSSGAEYEYFMIEGEIELNHNDYSFSSGIKGDLTSSHFMFNGLLKSSPIGSYLYGGLGVGLISVSLDGINDDLRGSTLAIQPILGANLEISNVHSFFVQYKYTKGLDLDLENNFARIEFDYNRSSIQFGVKYSF